MSSRQCWVWGVSPAEVGSAGPQRASRDRQAASGSGVLSWVPASLPGCQWAAPGTCFLTLGIILEQGGSWGLALPLVAFSLCCPWWAHLFPQSLQDTPMPRLPDSFRPQLQAA